MPKIIRAALASGCAVSTLAPLTTNASILVLAISTGRLLVSRSLSALLSGLLAPVVKVLRFQARSAQTEIACLARIITLVRGQ